MDKGIELLDRIHSEIIEKGIPNHTILDKLIYGLRDLRVESSVEDWEIFSRSTILKHPSLKLFHQDPFTSRSFNKPRGYDGDAKLLDFMYGYVNLESYNITKAGKALCDYTTNSSASKAVRLRRQIIAKTIDGLAKDISYPRIFSLACGHIREGDISEAIQNGSIKELVAMDYDKKALDLVDKEYSKFKIKPLFGSVRDLLQPKKIRELGEYDLVYVSGLYDYLSQRVATRLTSNLFSMLKPGGKLLISNFLPHIKDVGYMETFMDWRLIYRSASQLLDTAGSIPSDHVRDKKTFVEENQNITFSEIVKKNSNDKIAT